MEVIFTRGCGKLTKNGMYEVPKRKRNTKFRFDKRTNVQRTFGYCPRCGKWFRHVTVRIDPVPLLDEVYWSYFVGCDDCWDWYNYDQNMGWENTYGK